jgi:hypothetical protein
LLPENANDALKGRVLEMSLADLNKDEAQSFRKIKLQVQEIQGKNCLTSFYGMDFTSDKLRSLVKKWQVKHFLIIYIGFPSSVYVVLFYIYIIVVIGLWNLSQIFGLYWSYLYDFQLICV